ncbi:hypothetical protein NSK_000157 [Nannochloropsis salina CCMP1776]|jgi:hypothetical protein|nr:hypothetical protein NSK_000157 [Nannochloropsis salina CCMP1776]|eukprot:TFJ88586.1 hypothetical protein NSK_000157 [Nannochloropsis salina CCMP1776]
MFNMIKERAEDYVVGATGTVNGVHHDRRRSSACVGASGEKVGFKEGEEHRGQEEPQQKPQEETQPPSDAKENQKTTTLPPPIPEPERQPAAAPCQVLQPIPQDEEERTEMETPKEVAVGPPDAIGQIPGENDTGGHKRRNSY